MSGGRCGVVCENVTGRLSAKELNAPEPEVIAVLDELCKYHLIRNLEITDTNGKMHIYSYENSAEWVAFLTFAKRRPVTFSHTTPQRPPDNMA